MELKFKVWDNVDYMSQPFTLYDLQAGKVQFTRDCVVRQWTWKHDKKGVCIYTGDVLLCQGISDNFPVKYVIVFNEEESAFKMRFIDRFNNNETGFYDVKINDCIFKVFEVISNIYEAVELWA